MKYIFGLLLFNFYIAGAQSLPQDSTGKLRVMFWNLENYFDPFNDSLTLDEEYTPTGNMHWTWKKFQQKRNNIYKVIAAAGTPDPPAIIGLVEVENQFVLFELIKKTPLMKYDYGIVHHESPDSRGIDAALLYRKDLFSLLDCRFYELDRAGEEEFKTREIIYARGVYEEDTLHVFVNHWPSRSGGQVQSDARRCAAGLLLRKCTDSILSQSPRSKIIIVGDFNDTPLDESLLRCLGAINSASNGEFDNNWEFNKPTDDSSLINLSGILHQKKPDTGTHKFQGEWAFLDQVIVSPSLLFSSTGIRTIPENLQIFSPGFLLIQDSQFFGSKPYRTYNGMKYEGGYSDHLPVLIDLVSIPGPQQR